MERIVELSYKHKLAHLSSCLTMWSILDAVYQEKKADDIVVLSAGHAGLAQYVALEKYGAKEGIHVNAEDVLERFGVHPERSPADGIHVSSGSLGSAILVAVGLAMARPEHRVYCLLSDGECAEGTVWEALAFVKKRGLTNFRVHVNCNGYSAYDAVDREELEARILAFCPWAVVHKTENPPLDHLGSLEGHYHVLKTEEEAEKLKQWCREHYKSNEHCG